MKIKKTVSSKVIEANRSNSRKSTGPGHTAAASENATKHGLLAKKLRFHTEDEKEEFDRLVQELESEQQPAGRMEQVLIEEAAVCLWKLQAANDWEIRELANRRKAAKAILKSLVENCEGEELSLFDQGDGSHSAAQRGWDCEGLVIRTGTRNSEQEDAFGDKSGKAGYLQIEAKLSTSLDTILRYQGAIKRDLYRALAALRDMRRDREDSAL
jgi:hypothetical protein